MRIATIAVKDKNFEPVSLKLVGENERLKLYKEEKDAIKSNEYLAWYTLKFLWNRIINHSWFT